MLFLSIAHDYFLWHYTRAFKEIYQVWLNFLWFLIHFFSLPQLAKSWLSPFKRITEAKGKGSDFEAIAGYLVINLLSRLVGAFMRTIIISIGVTTLIFATAAGVAVYFAWIFIPILIIGGLVTGISLLFV